MATIRDVAAHSGISVKTVSRVLNGAPTVRPKVRAKVEQAMRDLNYRPALAARQLVTGRSFIIILLVPDVAHWYFSRMVMATAQACRAAGYHLLVEVFDRNALDHDENWSIRLSCDADAVIVLPPWSDHPRMLAALEGLALPAVRIAGQAEGYGLKLAVHDRAVSRALVEHLIDQGHRRIAMIAPPHARLASEERHLGYRDAMEGAGLAVPEGFVLRGTMTFESGRDALHQLMALPERPTAIFGVNDATALGAMSAALARGLRVPQDLALAGFDNSTESQYCWPALTTVEQPFDRIAQAAVALATGQQEDGEEGGAAMHPRLILRGSTLPSN